MKLLVLAPRRHSQSVDNFRASGMALSDVVMRAKHAQQLDISSTMIRNAILAGAFTSAARLIGNDAAAAIVFYCFVEADRRARLRSEQATRDADARRQIARLADERRRRRRLFIYIGVAILVAATAIVLKYIY